MADALTSEYIAERLQNEFGDNILTAQESYGTPVFEIKREVNVEILQFLKEDEELNFHFLTTLCGIHYPFQNEKELCVMYQLHNMISNSHIRLKTFFSADDSNVRTIINLWPSANWMERETFDFFGINFEGHPNMTRILNMEDMDYHPMLKQYPLEDQTRTDKDDTMFGRGLFTEDKSETVKHIGNG